MGYSGDQKREYDLKWRTERRDNWIQSKGGVCALCGSTENLEVDHVDPRLKTLQPRQIWSRRQEVRDAELAKCQVLCADCHHLKSTAESLVDHPHGSRGRYKKGCRCRPCTDVAVAYATEKRNARKLR